MMQQALQFLQDHNEIAFATCEGNLPKIRMFQIMNLIHIHFMKLHEIVNI